MIPLSAAERARRYRRRCGVAYTPPTCPSCGGAVGSKRSGIETDLCSRCWEKLTPEGREEKADRVRRTRDRRKQRKSDC